MSNPRVENWVHTQRKMVGPGSICVTKVVLVGPDGDAWGTWPIDMENLAEAISEALTVQGEERATGTYHAKLIGLDQGNDQIALLPVRVHGKAPQALGAGAEANSLQRATALAISSMQQIVEAQAGQIQKLADMVDSLHEDRSILIEEHVKQESQNLDVELRREEWLREQRMKDEVWVFLKDQVAPQLLPAISIWAENQDEKRKERKASQDNRKKLEASKFPPGWPGPSDDVPPTQEGLGSGNTPSTDDGNTAPRDDGTTSAAATSATPAGDVAESSSKRSVASPTDLLEQVLKSGKRKDQAGAADAPEQSTPGTSQAANAPPPGLPTEVAHDRRSDHEPTDGAGGNGAPRSSKAQTDGPVSVPANSRTRTRSRRPRTTKR